MNVRSQEDKANRLLDLHTSGELLLLPNVWNPIGARVLEAKGYPAVATASAALSASLGYQDGERIRRSTLVEFLRRIARSVEVPVTADIETGYGATLAEVRETTAQVLDAGVVGINLEDSIEEGGELRAIAGQCERISAIREFADQRGVHLVVNARVDCFLSSSFPDKAKAMEETVLRARAYSEAGADCIYPLGPGDAETVRVLRERIRSPINILATPSAAPISVMRGLGVNRLSFGPFVFRSCLGRFVDIAERLRADTGHVCLPDMLSGAEVGSYLLGESE